MNMVEFFFGIYLTENMFPEVEMVNICNKNHGDDNSTLFWPIEDRYCRDCGGRLCKEAKDKNKQWVLNQELPKQVLAKYKLKQHGLFIMADKLVVKHDSKCFHLVPILRAGDDELLERLYSCFKELGIETDDLPEWHVYGR